MHALPALCDRRPRLPGLAVFCALCLASLQAWAELPSETTIGNLEQATGFEDQMPTGVTVSADNRIFVTFPRWGDPVKYTVGEVKDSRTVAYPNEKLNQFDRQRPGESFINVQSAVVDPQNRLWLLDTGSINFGKVLPGGAKLIGIDLETDEIFKTITFPDDVVLPTTYLNDVRFDLRRGDGGMAFITDSSTSGPNGIIVVELGSGKSWRTLHNHPSTRPVQGFWPIVEGQVLLTRPEDGPAEPFLVGSDGIAIHADGKRLFYCPLSSRHLYSVRLDALADPDKAGQAAETVEDHGDRGFASDGLSEDSKGRIYLTNYEDNAILRREEDGSYQTIVHDPRALWPDTIAISRDEHLYFIANQLHRQPRFHRGQDLRNPPYSLFRIKIDAGPVLLGKQE